MKIQRIILLLVLLLSSIDMAHKFQAALLMNAFKENAGAKESIPQEVLDIKELASAKKQHFKVCDEIRGDPLLFQRTVEYLYPLRIDNTSNLLFCTNQISPIDQCKKIDSKGKIDLYECH